MKFTKLRIAGFKTFVEPAEFLIEPGLTGIVGPNGCGKSNLVEALRWVMGESSSKSMRASGMEDVIFSGSGERPARNMAEVVLYLDNSDRSAPAPHNESEVIEVSRHIMREAGSAYKINGREVRARDVQLLFADASTGAHSPAMVRQGQIGEIISAKPQERRRILEEAAGIAGLHSRRHEAELRLKAAEDNLARLDDIMRQIDNQADSLKKQVRQATRYRNLAGNIRQNEALLALINQTAAARALGAAEEKLKADVLRVAEKTKAQAEAARLQAIAAHELPALRDAEVAANAALQRFVVARETLDGEERRVKARTAELERAITQAAGDATREAALIEDANAALARLDEEAAGLESSQGAEGLAEALEARVGQAQAALALTERTLAEVQDKKAKAEAQRSAVAAAIGQEKARLVRLEAEHEKISEERAALFAAASDGADPTALESALGEAIAYAKAREDDLSAIEAAHAKARQEEERTRAPLAEAERKAASLETQVATLSKLLTAQGGGFWPPVTEEIAVEKGYEAALGAALGDDLEASTNEASPAHWALTDGAGDPALPPGVAALSELVTAPASLMRRLNQIGVCLRTEGASLRALLKPGQRLVSKEGDLWRWDGFTQAAEAPTPAARRLAEKNRLGDLSKEAQSARAAAGLLKEEAARARLALQASASAEKDARDTLRSAQRAVEDARTKKEAAEKRRTQASARLAALDEALVRLDAACTEAGQKLAQSEAELAGLDPQMDLSAQLEDARAAAAQDRALVAQANGELQAHIRETKTRAKRLESIAQECSSWIARRERALDQIGTLETRRDEAEKELQRLTETVGDFHVTRRGLLSELEAAEVAAKRCTDERVAAEARLATADRAARAALEEMSSAREEKARSEERLEATRARSAEIAHFIATEIGETEAGLFALAGIKAGDDLPPAELVEKRLEGLKADRERLGGVNLRAEDELNEVLGSRTNLAAEHEDLTGAIKRLRQAIHNLNSEGRGRLLSAFESVQGHFKELFTTLFGGGTAELQLVESDDPLEAGLEILVRPPGKKPQAMTLLSGGEQALAAMSLIFAIFLTNPAPICVLDEVDAPLDDANVERFCDLLDAMRAKTETRFVTITHNPITMARMNRLFGVTMAERGVSQLVSVNLEEAQELREAG